eukprot:1187819-Prorocentrum_minimum.AAC.2
MQYSRAYSHDGPIRRSTHEHILMMDQTNQTQYSRAYSPDGPNGGRPLGTHLLVVPLRVRRLQLRAQLPGLRRRKRSNTRVNTEVGVLLHGRGVPQGPQLPIVVTLTTDATRGRGTFLQNNTKVNTTMVCNSTPPE